MARCPHTLNVFPLACSLPAVRAMPSDGALQLHFGVMNPPCATIVSLHRLYAADQQKSTNHQQHKFAESRIHLFSSRVMKMRLMEV
jgi:hypothetical protein